jgi:hypothetical protein
MNWEKTLINLGTIKQGTTVPLVFKALKKLSITQLKPGCGSCTFVKAFNPDTLELGVTFKVGSIPIHLRKQGYYNTRKSITVTYEDGTSEILSFTARIEL